MVLKHEKLVEQIEKLQQEKDKMKSMKIEESKKASQRKNQVKNNPFDEKDMKILNDILEKYKADLGKIKTRNKEYVEKITKLEDEMEEMEIELSNVIEENTRLTERASECNEEESFDLYTSRKSSCQFFTDKKQRLQEDCYKEQERMLEMMLASRKTSSQEK